MENKPLIKFKEATNRLQKRRFQKEYDFLYKVILKYELAFEKMLFDSSNEYQETFNELKELFIHELNFLKRTKRWEYLFINSKYIHEKYKAV
jgi:hypothetical protein